MATLSAAMYGATGAVGSSSVIGTPSRRQDYDSRSVKPCRSRISAANAMSTAAAWARLSGS